MPQPTTPLGPADDAPPFPSPALCLAGLVAIAIAAAGPGVEDRAGGTSPARVGLHGGRIEAVAYSPDGRLVASAGSDGTTKTWDVAAGRQRTVFTSGVGGFSTVAFSRDGRMIAAGTLDGRAFLADLAGGRPPRIFRANDPGGAVRVVAFSPDGAMLATGGDDRSVRIWDVRSGGELARHGGHEAQVRGLAYTPDGRAILSASADGRVISREARTGKPIARFDGEVGPLWAVAVSPDGRWAAIGGERGLTLLDLEEGRGRTCRTDRGPVTALAWRPGGTSLGSASLRGAVTLWDLEPGGLRASRDLDGQDSLVKALALSPDGTILVTGSDDAHLRFWNL